MNEYQREGMENQCEPTADAEVRIRRVTKMEEIYDRSAAATEALIRAAEAYLSLEEELAELETYYEHGSWLSDFDADRLGKLPKDMKRGILTEDAIYDLLTDRYRMMQTLREMVECYEAATKR